MMTKPLPTYTLLCFIATSLIATSLAAGLDDHTPPVTDCILTGIMQDDFYISNVTIKLNATDDFSGVNATYYSIDNGNVSVYSTPFIVTGNGFHTVTYYSIDNASNIEAPKNATFTIVLAAPVAITITGGIGPVCSVTNVGTEDLIETPFSISLDNGVYLVGQCRNGTVTIHVGETVLLRSVVIGLGEPTIRVRVGRTDASIEAFVFGPIVIRL